MLARLLLRAVLTTISLGLSACSIITPAPLWEMVKAGGMALDTAVAQGPSDASYLVHHGDKKPNSLCIEYNPDTQVADILPAIQNELKTHDIESRIYEISGILDQCPIWLKYSASMEWDTPSFSSTYQPFMNRAMFTLQRSNGEIIASSGYELGKELQMGKWSSTRNKIARAIHALVSGEIEKNPQKPNGAQP